MKGWLLDTNVISELRKSACHRAVRAFVDAQNPATLFLSEVTFAEIRFGIGRVSDPAFRTELEQWLETVLRPWFADRLLPITEDVILAWRVMVEEGKTRGHTFGQPDLFIAATAAIEELIVVSRDTSQFQQAGVPVFDPWQGTFKAAGNRARKVADVPPAELLQYLSRLLEA